MTKILLLIYLGFLVSGIGFSQQVLLQGSIKDTLNNSLENTNILFFPISDNDKVRFSITDQKGVYKIKLEKNVQYSIEISYLGYNTYKDTIQINQDTIKNIVLTASSQSLDEVLLTERIPIKIREDTITYRPEKFLTGEERKLRDVLKKLPGIEVDSDGNVEINGKAVTKFLVDGKDFFTGDEKLGVNNIPANVIDEIEALDNYNEVSFLKGLNDSEQLALNIKLKDGKKKFVFGNVDVGRGIEDRYVIHPTFFYYSPKTTVNAIGDFNNIGKKSFTVQDYVNFEGGFTNLNEELSTYFRLFNDEFAQFLSQRDFVFNRNNFGAFSINQKINSNLKLNGYSILSGGTIETQQANSFIYIFDQNTNENRITTQNSDLFFSINKVALRYIGKKNIDVKYEAFLKTNTGEAITNIQSLTITDTTFINQQNSPSSINFTQKISANKQFSKLHTTSLNTSYKYLNNDSHNTWAFNQPIFTELIPIDNSQETILINQNRENRLHEFKLNVKHYWVLHRYHHIYPEAGINRIDQNYQTIDNQEISSSINNFSDSGFNNNIQYGLTESYIGLQYKAKAGNFIFKPGLFYHYYDWNIKQFDQTIRNTGKPILLPQLNINWDFNTHKIKLKYNLLSQFGEASQFANRLRLQSFNQLFSGNPNLENEVYQRLNLNYNKFNAFKGSFFNIGINYSNRIRSIRNNTNIEGIDQINTLIYTSLPENSYNSSFSLTKILRSYKVSLGTSVSLFDYSRLINNTTQDFQSINYSYNIKGIKKFKNGPNIELVWKQSFSIFNAINSSNRFTQISPSISLEYRFLRNLVLKSDYNFTYFENKDRNEINRFSIGNASLLYNKEDSPWTIELESSNIFDTQFRNENSFSQFLVSDTRTFIQPRVILLKIGYSF